MTDDNPWLDFARQAQELLAQQHPEVQQAHRELSRRQYRQPPPSPPDPEIE